MSRRTRGLVLGAVGVVVALVAWVVGTTVQANVFFPTPQVVLARAAEFWGSAEGLHHVASSVGNLLLGLLLATVIGVGLGVLVGGVPLLATATAPIVEFLRAIPSTALLPVALLLFGLGDDMKLFIITLGSTWPVLLNTIAGVRQTEPVLRDTARVYQLGWGQRLAHVVLPAAAPRIATGVRIAIPISLILMVTSELVGASEGIGFVIVDAQATFRLVDMWSGIVLLAVLGFVLTSVFRMLERRLLRWAPAEREAR
jgi:ABC-type nitrate/sulfonate/bicarbonate transport system permease component